MPGTIDMKNKMRDMIRKRNVVIPEKIRNKSTIQKKILKRKLKTGVTISRKVTNFCSLNFVQQQCNHSC